MAKGTKSNVEPIRKRSPGKTVESRENSLISMAFDLLERRILDGTASSQELTTLIKMGTSRERTEREILEGKKELIKAQTDNLKSQKTIEVLIESALSAMRRYTGKDDGDEEYDEYD